MIDCTSVSDVNFCPCSIFLYQTCTVGCAKHLSPYTSCNECGPQLSAGRRILSWVVEFVLLLQNFEEYWKMTSSHVGSVTITAVHATASGIVGQLEAVSEGCCWKTVSKSCSDEMLSYVKFGAENPHFCKNEAQNWNWADLISCVRNCCDLCQFLSEISTVCCKIVSSTFLKLSLPSC